MPAVPEVTFLGHSMTRIALPGGVVLTDPVLRGRVTFLEWVAPPLTATGADLDVDAVLVSHLHHDHCDLPSLRRLGRHRTLIVPGGTAPFFRRHGFDAVVALRPGESHRVGEVQVTATPAVHDGRRYPIGPRTLAAGYLVTGGGVQVYFAGDTALFPGMRTLAADLDLALLPVAGWGRTLGPGHLDPRDAAEAARLLEPRLAVPIHWGGLRPLWQRDAVQVTPHAARSFAAEVARRSSPTTAVLLQPGESVRVSGRPRRPARAAAPPPPPSTATT